MLDHDCIRDVLLYLDNDFSPSVDKIKVKKLADVQNLNQKYSQTVIFQSTWWLISEGLIICHLKPKLSISMLSPKDTSKLVLSHISPKGYKFVEAIRSDTVWNKIKNACKNTFTVENVISMASLGISITQVL